MATKLGLKIDPHSFSGYDSTHSIVDYNPETTQGVSERPVTDENIHGVQRHRNDADDEVCDRLIDDEYDEVGVKFLLVFVGEQDEEVGHGTDSSEDEENRGNGDHMGADIPTR